MVRGVVGGVVGGGRALRSFSRVQRKTCGVVRWMFVADEDIRTPPASVFSSDATFFLGGMVGWLVLEIRNPIR